MSEAIPVSSQQVDGNEGVERQFKGIIGPPGCTTCKYERLRVLGSGSFGKALLVRRTSDNLQLVAKRMDLAAMSEKDKSYVKAEIQCLAACDHFAVIEYYEDFVEDDHMLIVMEYADAGDLNMQIKQRAREKAYFEEHEVGYTFVQLAMAVDHIHRRRMLHRDIKGANVMLMTSGIIKLGDFGFSHMYDMTVSNLVATTFCGTPYYLAPEFWHNQAYSKKADVWAMGILLFEMMALQRPFLGQGMKALAESVTSGRRSCALPDKYSAPLHELCNIMLQPDPNKRPSCAELFKLPHMVRLLGDFETSVDNSQLVSDALKKKIHANIREIRETNVNDLEAPTYVGRVGAICLTVYYEGTVRKESGNAWKERFLVLRDGNLVISRTKGDKEAKPLSVEEVSSVVPIPHQTASSPGVFAINLRDGKTLWFQALPPETAGTWVHKIQRAIGVS